ncbi:WYL domain-containing protein [Undibacterium sp. Tian12W]|uniref:WYL domain-containing protein n=1 Tax=Undibacterium sp. Tian12W TaxID=3413054 RepID=UPI003BF16598
MTNSADLPISDLALLLQWEGSLSNARIRDLFDVKSVRASNMIKEFRDEHPTWLVHDSKTKAFYPSSDYLSHQRKHANRRHHADELARYLALVGLHYATQAKDEHHHLLCAHTDLTAPPPRPFAMLQSAAKGQRKVRITYRSMNHPEPHQRTISPHTLVRAGRRWHARAFCEEAGEFRDFSLGRISKVEELGQPSERYVSDDKPWQFFVKVTLVPHPELTPEQSLVIRAEYMAGAAALTETCRGALVKYFVQDMRAAVHTQQRPPEYQLAVSNIKEIEQWLFLK